MPEKGNSIFSWEVEWEYICEICPVSGLKNFLSAHKERAMLAGMFSTLCITDKPAETKETPGLS